MAEYSTMSKTIQASDTSRRKVPEMTRSQKGHGWTAAEQKQLRSKERPAHGRSQKCYSEGPKVEGPMKGGPRNEAAKVQRKEVPGTMQLRSKDRRSQERRS